MHGDKPVQQKHASSQAGNPSYRWWLYVSIVINSTLGILCMASIVFVAVHDDLTGLSGAAIVGSFLSCASSHLWARCFASSRGDPFGDDDLRVVSFELDKAHYRSLGIDGGRHTAARHMPIHCLYGVEKGDGGLFRPVCLLFFKTRLLAEGLQNPRGDVLAHELGACGREVQVREALQLFSVGDHEAVEIIHRHAEVGGDLLAHLVARGRRGPARGTAYFVSRA